MMLSKKAQLATAAIVAVIAMVATAWTSASGTSQSAAPEADTTAGVRETLLLVVADVVPTPEALTSLRAVNEPFDELQGFYADAAIGYEVIGALLQTSPDLITEECGASLDLGAVGVASQHVDTDCLLGDVTRTLQPISTKFVELGELPTLESASVCAMSGDACGLARLRELLGEDLQLQPNTTLLGTAFRTRRGVEEFLELARAGGVTGLVTLQVKKLSGGDVGLGQEPAPDGSGPLTAPLPAQEQYQR